MALQTEVWSQDIQENLFAGNEFVMTGTDHSMWISNKTVHLPQAGANPDVKKNRAVLPATISERTDTDLTYSMNDFTTSPVLITDVEEIQNSYAKRNSVFGHHISALGDVIGNQTAYAWASSGAGNVFNTTGTSGAGALAPSATGNRKAITLADILTLKNKLDMDNVPQSGRILLMPAALYNIELLAIADVYQAQSYGQSALPSGVVNRIHGFDIMVRPSVVVFDNSATPVIKAIDDDGTPTTEATTDNLACIAYHPNYVAQAVGSTKIFMNEDDAAYYGTYLSGLQMFGAAKIRTDQAGVAVLAQDN